MRTNYSINIGVGHGVDIGITQDSRLVASFSNGGHSFVQIDFGQDTRQTFDNLIEYLQRLRIHAN